MHYYPLQFKEILRDYGFGSRWITETYQKTGLPDNHRIAETWEICDRPMESSKVVNGQLAGATLHELIQKDPVGLLGTEIYDRFGAAFPLLIKLLDVSNPLGEQIHHSDALAAKEKLEDPGKTEAWYMLHTRPGAQIYCGQNNDAVNNNELRESLKDGNIKELMKPYSVKPGDSFLLYAGTMHYSPGGVLFYEIMQNSDVYIGLRNPDPNLHPSEQQRQENLILDGIHLEDGYECKTTPLQIESGLNERYFILACQHFALEQLELSAPYRVEEHNSKFYFFTLIEGSCILNSDQGNLRLVAGQSCLLPAALEETTVIPEERCSLLKAYVPNLEKDVILPLKNAGHSNESILKLGGKTRLNPMNQLVQGL